ncbi:MAG: 2-oxoacid ferredoxin oxidoreductase [Synergistaceae bacterium]|jgi:2-oxoglutarate ferredoxin oxidoreductase subunit beta|nr:2-oxoacid ferredoxin oxidoreductase [Synergistaceae bacterium]
MTRMANSSSDIFSDVPSDVSFNSSSERGAVEILNSLYSALAELDLRPEEVILVSGHEKALRAVEPPKLPTPHRLGVPYGCALPAATGIRAANPRLSVIAIGSDGDMYGAGGNHFLQTIRRNPNVTHIVFHTVLCGEEDTPRSWRTGGAMNPLTVALCCGASFVARGSAGEPEFTQLLMKRAMIHQGYALLDILVPDVLDVPGADKERWLADNTYKLEDNIDGERLIDHVEAMNLAFEAKPYPLGVLYDCRNLPTLEEGLAPWQKDDRPLSQREAPLDAVWEYMKNL